MKDLSQFKGSTSKSFLELNKEVLGYQSAPTITNLEPLTELSAVEESEGAVTFPEPRDYPPRSTDEQKLNKLERDWLVQLRARFQRPHYKIYIQAINLKLANDCRYLCDFAVVNWEGKTTFFETKGGWMRDDARVKLLVAARMFPFYRFILVTRKKGCAFVEEVVKP